MVRFPRSFEGRDRAILEAYEATDHNATLVCMVGPSVGGVASEKCDPQYFDGTFYYRVHVELIEDHVSIVNDLSLLLVPKLVSVTA